MKISETYYGGEALPVQQASFGPCQAAAYYGAEPHFEENTTWFGPPVIKDWNNLPAFSYDPDNKWWNVAKRLVEILGEKEISEY